MKLPTIDESIARVKSEVFKDALNGVVPFAVVSFSALHDFVDANEYGGFCEDELHDALHAAYALEHEDGFNAYVNAVHGAVDLWLRDGGLALKLWLWVREGENHGLC